MNCLTRSLAVLFCLGLSSLPTANAHAQESVLYDFTATWCGPCKQMAPVVHKLAAEGYPIKQVDIDQNPGLARQYNVSSIPAFVLVVNGKEVAREIGRTSEHQLRRMLGSIPSKKPAAPANTAPPQQKQATIIAAGNNGLEQPRLGTAEAFPPAALFQEAPVNTPATNSGSIWPAAPAQMAQSEQPNQAVIRAQIDKSNGVTKPTPHIDSAAANVRLRIRDEKGINYGSGTIIDSKPGATHILTCGHVFRNLTEASKVDVDVFVGDRFESFVGKVLSYDLDADVGVVTIPTDGVLPVAKLATSPARVQTGDEVISVGCSGGQAPTTENLSVTALNRYTGPDNIECTGVPVQGRSGGGLFNDANEVIGVCFAADRKGQRGLYAGLDPIIELLTKCGLEHVIRTKTQDLPDTQIALGNGQDSPFGAEPPVAVPSSNVMAAAQPAAPGMIDPAQTQQMLNALSQAQGAKLTILIEDPRHPGRPQVVVIPAATPRLLADLKGELPMNTVATNRMTTPAEQVVPVQDPSVVPPPARMIRTEDRSSTLPTQFHAAQPYRR